MTTRSSASIAMLMRVDDLAGRQIEIDRDVLRRAYIALLAMGRQIYAHHRPTDLFPEEALSMSFFEPGPGEAIFEVEVVTDSHLRAEQQAPADPFAVPDVVDTQDRALQLTAQTLVEIVRTCAFVLSAPQTVREVQDDHVDLTDPETDRRLRVSGYVHRGMVHRAFDENLREFLFALTREGVGGVSLASGGRLQRAQIHYMTIASDRVIEFVRGGDLPGAMDRRDVQAQAPAGS